MAPINLAGALLRAAKKLPITQTIVFFLPSE